MYELILQGIESNSRDSRNAIVRALNEIAEISHAKLEQIKTDAPLSVKIAEAKLDLMPLYKELQECGGDVLIVEHSTPPRHETPFHLRQVQEKSTSLEQLAVISKKLRDTGKRIVLVHGVFDILHIGHIRLLNRARDHGDIIAVSVVADKSVNRGPGSPFFSQALRMETLANLSVVDYVVVVDSDNALPAIEMIQPHVIIRGQRPFREHFDFCRANAVLEDQAIERIGGRSVSIPGAEHSTSELTNKFFEIYPEETTKFLRDFSQRWTFERIVEAISSCKNLKVLVVGDAIIDHYHYCKAMGKSAKENLVVNQSLEEEVFAGGVVATANHIAQMCEHVDMVTLLGADKSYEELILRKLDYRVTPHLFYRNSGSTTVKKRYVSKEQNQKLFEICNINDSELNTKEESALSEFLSKSLNAYDLVVVNDFGHGMLSPKLIKILCEESPCLALNVQVNGANQGFNLATNYKRADFVCIDERELRLATRDRNGDMKSLMKKVTRNLTAHQLIATRGQHGSISLTREDGFCTTPAFATSSVDKIGAGDAFFAYTAPCFAAGIPQDLTTFLGNCAGALKVQIVGNKEQVRLNDLMRFVERLLKH
jgi:rfaE bifunctional protein kinase chain/domain/rfaE bifunctional protein nucleotidyltransferase chain/domain